MIRVTSLRPHFILSRRAASQSIVVPTLLLAKGANFS